MNVNVRPLSGPWTSGHALDKHTVSSRFIGEDENGRAQFETQRTEVGEAVFQLKYRGDWSQVGRLADAAVRHGIPNADRITAVVPMPASTARARQPVTELASAIAKRLGVPMLDILGKAPTPQIKNLSTRDEKMPSWTERSRSMTFPVRGIMCYWSTTCFTRVPQWLRAVVPC